jgi:catechol 2,3-dioxygenase-like lactoylglutathione lyase family enzyme
MSTIAYKGDLTCAMQVSNIEQSIEWFRDHLGFEVAFRVDEMGWCELSGPVAGVTVGLSQVEKPEVRGGATLVWGVEDIDRARQALESAGVRFDGDTLTIEGMVRLATFFDPDGNKFMLSQTLATG